MKKYALSNVLCFVVLAIFGLMGFGCVKKVYVPVENVKEVKDSLRQKSLSDDFHYKMVCDSVISSDSVLIKIRGDSVLVREVRYVARIRLKTDTVKTILIDTVYINHEEVSVKSEPVIMESCTRSRGRDWLGIVVIVGIVGMAIWFYTYKKIKG